MGVLILDPHYPHINPHRKETIVPAIPTNPSSLINTRDKRMTYLVNISLLVLLTCYAYRWDTKMVEAYNSGQWEAWLEGQYR